MSVKLAETASSSGSRLRTISLPWETLTQIYSYCDNPTLVALSLVSFGSWESAGPFLYEHIELTRLDQLKSLFFLDTALDEDNNDEEPERDGPPLHRVESSASFLTRIRSLTLNIQSLEQTSDARLEIDQDDRWDKDGIVPRYQYEVSISDEEFEGPHRLARSSWILDRLTVLSSGRSLRPLDQEYDEDHLLDFFAARLFPYLNPRHVVFRWPNKDEWRVHSLKTPLPDFVDNWDVLESVEYDGQTLDGWDVHEVMYGSRSASDAYRPIWTRGWSDSAKPLRLVFDFAGRAELFEDLVTGEWEQPVFFETALARGGVTEDAAKCVAFTVVMRIKAEDREKIEAEIAILDDWAKDVIVVEIDSATANASAA